MPETPLYDQDMDRQKAKAEGSRLNNQHLASQMLIVQTRP